MMRALDRCDAELFFDETPHQSRGQRRFSRTGKADDPNGRCYCHSFTRSRLS
jgi:hypothetical protein